MHVKKIYIGVASLVLIHDIVASVLTYRRWWLRANGRLTWMSWVEDEDLPPPQTIEQFEIWLCNTPTNFFCSN